MKLIKHLIFQVLTSLKLGYKALPSVSSILVYSFTARRDEETNRSSPLNDIAQSGTETQGFVWKVCLLVTNVAHECFLV